MVLKGNFSWGNSRGIRLVEITKKVLCWGPAITLFRGDGKTLAPQALDLTFSRSCQLLYEYLYFLWVYCSTWTNYWQIVQQKCPLLNHGLHFGLLRRSVYEATVVTNTIAKTEGCMFKNGLILKVQIRNKVKKCSPSRNNTHRNQVQGSKWKLLEDEDSLEKRMKDSHAWTLALFVKDCSIIV